VILCQKNDINSATKSPIISVSLTQVILGVWSEQGIMRLFWLIMAILAALLIFLWWRDMLPASVSSDDFAQASRLGIIALLIAASVLASGIKMVDLLRHCLVWFSLIMVLIIGYHHRYYLQDITHQLTAGLVPSSPIARYDAGNLTVTLRRGPSGHFETRALVNGRPLFFMLDTGASRVVLAHEDAVSIGLDVNNLTYSVTTSTANGLAQAAPVRLQSVDIGGIERRNVSALVMRPRAMSGSLLGMSFLNSLSGYTVRADQLTLVD